MSKVVYMLILSWPYAKLCRLVVFKGGDGPTKAFEYVFRALKMYNSFTELNNFYKTKDLDETELSSPLHKMVHLKTVFFAA